MSDQVNITEDRVIVSPDETSVEVVTVGIQGPAGASTNAVTSVAGKLGDVVLDKNDVGLGNVDNTSDANKPVSTATQTALNAKYNASNPSGYVNASQAATAAPVQSVAGKTGSVSLVKGDVGLNNVDNTSDANKPVSTAQAASIATKEPAITAGTTSQYYRGDKTFQTLNQDAVPDGTTNKAFTSTEKTKLSNVASGATANSTDAQLRDRSTHTGTQSADTIVDGTTNKVLTATDKTRLANTSGTNTGDQVISDATITTSDITTNNASTTKHGFLPKLSGTATQYLDGTGAFSTPAGSTVGDATATTKGVVQLAGDLSGTAAAPKVKGKLTVFNVMDYGATGNGTTEDTTAIQAAFDAASAAATGGTVFFPAGTFLTGQITWRAKTNIIGSGIGRTILKAKNALNNDLIKTENFATEHNVNYNGYSTMSKNFARDFTMDGNLSNQTLQAEQTDKSAYRYLIKYYGWIPYFERLEFRNAEAAFFTEYSNNQPQEFEWYNISDGLFRDLTMINYARAGWTFYGPHDSHVSNIRIFGGNYDAPEYDWLVGLSGTWGAQGAMVDDVHIRSADTSTGYNVILKAGINGRIYAEGSTNINVLVESDGSNLQIFSGFQDADNNTANDGMVVLRTASSGSSVSKNIIEAIAYYGPMYGDVFRLDNSAGGTMNSNKLTTRINNGASVTGHLFRFIGNMNSGFYEAGGGQASLAPFNTDLYTGGNNEFAGQVYGQSIFTTETPIGKSDKRSFRSDNYPDAQRLSQYRWPVGDKSPGFISTGSDTYIDADSMQVRNVQSATANAHAVNKGQMDAANALKANIASPSFTGTPTAPTPSAGDSTTKIATTAFVSNAVSGLDDVLAYANLAAFPPTGTAGTIYIANDTNFLYRWSGSAYVQVGGGGAAGVSTVNTRSGDVVLSKSDVGLANVDNTSDADKPVSTAQQTALNGKEPTIPAGTTAQYIRGNKTLATLDKAAVGLSNVDNTTDADKPVSTATQTALTNGLATKVSTSSDTSTNLVYTRLLGVEGTTAVSMNASNNTIARRTGAGELAVASATASGNAVNKGQLDAVSGAKQDTLVSGTNIKTINGNSVLGSGDLTISGGGNAPDATTTSKGIVQLAGDLGGTAASPQVLNGQTVYYNYISNPSFETSLAAGWTTYGGGTKSRDTSGGQFGTANAQQSSATAVDGGFMQSVTLPAGTFTLSFYAKMTSDVTRSNAVVRNNGVTGETQIFRAYPGNANWNRYSQTFTNPTGGTVEILVGLGYSGSSPGTVNFDGFQVELASSASPYFDGASTGDATTSYAWSGTANESNSYRTTRTRMTSTDSLPEGSVNQYYTNARALAAITNATIAPNTVNTGVLFYSGSLRSGIATLTANTTLNTGFASRIDLNASSAAFNVTLYSTTTPGYRYRFYKNDTSTNDVTIVGSINGVSNYVLSGMGAWLEIESTSTSGQWKILDSRLKVTTTGTSGAATFDGITLNIPQYTGGGGGGSTFTELNTRRVASSTATAAEKASADYVTDGTADDVEINAALSALKAAGGGRVQLSSGVFNLAAPIYMEGVNTPDDTPGLQLIGAAGGNTTRFVGAVDTDVIVLRYMPQVRIKDLHITMNGTGTGIRAIANTSGANDRRGFWNSQFENLYFLGTNSHSGWCLNLENPFRSTFKQMGTGNGVKNGMRFASTYAAFNPGNCTVEVCQMGLSIPNGISYMLESANDGGFMNIMSFTECDSIDNAASTNSIGWYFKGSSTNYFTVRDMRIIGANPEQFNTAVKFEKAANIRFLGDFINPKNGGYVADVSADSVNNRVEVEYIYIDGNKTVNAFRDLNTDALKPNHFINSFARVESGATLTFSPSTATVFNNLARDSDGTGVYPSQFATNSQIANRAYVDTQSATKLSKTTSDTLADGVNIAVGSTTGTQIGTSPSQKIGFLGGTPVVRQSGSSDLGSVLSAFNLRVAGNAYPITTSASVALTGSLRLGVGSITATTTLSTTSAPRQEITASSAAIDITPPATTTAGQVIKFLRLDSTSQTVRLLGTFNGATNFTITGQYKSVDITTTTTSGVFRVWYNN